MIGEVPTLDVDIEGMDGLPEGGPVGGSCELSIY